jgi:tyrosine-protein kinase Etk/Wzc
MASEERNLLDYIYVLVKWRRLIIIPVLVVAAATAVVSLVLPKAWTARTTLLPPEEEGEQLGLSMLLGPALSSNLSGLMSGTPSERLVTILGSKRVLGAVVDRFGLIDAYGAPNRDVAVEMLDDRIEEELAGDGTLIIDVTASNAETAAAMANEIARQIDVVNRDRKSGQARALREFLYQRLETTEAELGDAGLLLQQFQEKHGLVDIEAQTNATVEVLRTIVQELALVEVELSVLAQSLDSEHEERQLKELEVKALHEQLLKMRGDMQVKRDGATTSALETLGPPLRSLPQLGFEFAKLSLDMTLKEQIIGFLGAKYEEARYREALNTPTIQVLDKATAPAMRSAPRRTVMVVLAAGVSLVVSVLLAFALESSSRLEGEQLAKIESIKQAWRGR